MFARLLVTCALVGFGAVAPSPAVAQDATTLHGAWFGGGIGTASAQVNCELCINDRNGGLSGYLAGGLRLNAGLHAGAELAGWFDNTDDVSQRLLLYGASLWWHPRPGQNWFLKGGLGLLKYRAATDDDDDDPLTAGTAAIQLGGGYDLRAGRKLWVSPFANLIVTTSGNMTSGNTVVTDASFSMLQLGAGVTWR
ncbi:MAG TPA: outer membrane beta-barrel protein [Gemmatimonadales bacterium]|nr:outer membrane beta-barrel protein [Gemmatimonadales bacterium]